MGFLILFAIAQASPVSGLETERTSAVFGRFERASPSENSTDATRSSHHSSDTTEERGTR